MILSFYCDTTTNQATEAPSPHEVRLIPLNTNPVFQCLGEILVFSLELQRSYFDTSYSHVKSLQIIDKFCSVSLNFAQGPWVSFKLVAQIKEMALLKILGITTSMCKS